MDNMTPAIEFTTGDPLPNKAGTPKIVKKPHLAIGRIVRFVDPGTGIAPAIITKVWSPECVNLIVFFDSDSVPVGRWTSVLYNASGSGPSTWHWPRDEAEVKA